MRKFILGYHVDSLVGEPVAVVAAAVGVGISATCHHNVVHTFLGALVGKLQNVPFAFFGLDHLRVEFVVSSLQCVYDRGVHRAVLFACRLVFVDCCLRLAVICIERCCGELAYHFAVREVLDVQFGH